MDGNAAHWTRGRKPLHLEIFPTQSNLFGRLVGASGKAGTLKPQEHRRSKENTARQADS